MTDENGSMNVDGKGIYNAGSCVVSGSYLKVLDSDFHYDYLIENMGELVIVNSNFKSSHTILGNYEKLHIEGSILETSYYILGNSGEAVMKDCVGKGSIFNSGEELSIINCNITSLFDVIDNRNLPNSKVVIDNSVLETLGNGRVIIENSAGRTGTAVVEICNSSLIAPASGYAVAIAEPEPTETDDSATGQSVAPDVSDTKESEEAEEEDIPAGKTFTINKVSVENPEAIHKAYEHSTIHTDSIDVRHMLPEDCGDVSYKVTTTGNIHYVTY